MEQRTPGEIDAMHAAGQVVARALAAMRTAVDVGVSPTELDTVGADVLTDAGADSPFLDYHPSWAPSPFPGVSCISVNDAIVHGIPSSSPLVDGDLVSIDFGAVLDGWCGDAAISFVVGTPNDLDLKLVDATVKALDAGIAAATPGSRIGDVANAIGRKARRGRYGLLEAHGGHGIGHTMHEAPFVPNEGRKRTGPRLEPGTVIAIEPMLIAGGGDAYYAGDDGWTLFSADGSRTAHVEHTVAVTANGPRVLTSLEP
ncbi:MAG: type I methionyl aminopeptidase [Nocardioidaceae bacterium]